MLISLKLSKILSFFFLCAARNTKFVSQRPTSLKIDCTIFDLDDNWPASEYTRIGVFLKFSYVAMRGHMFFEVLISLVDSVFISFEMLMWKLCGFFIDV